MAATFVHFEKSVENLADKIFDLFGTAGAGADTLKVMLSNIGPDASTNGVKADITEITQHNGYGGGVSTGNVGARASSVVTMTATNITITAAGGTIGPFQYVVLYDDTPGSPVKPLVGYWDLGLALTLQDGESVVLKFNGGSGSGTVLTLAQV